jgi:hypothetical protein
MDARRISPTLHRLAARTLAAALLATLAALLIARTPASAAPAGVAGHGAPSFSVSGSLRPIAAPAAYRTRGAVFFDNTHVPLRLQTTAYYVVVGQRKGDHYEYPYQLVAARGSTVAAIEIAANFTAHTQLIAVGMPTAASLAATMGATPTGGQSATSAAPGGSRATSLGRLSASTSGYYRTVWHDPINIEVNEVKDTINFTYDGVYVDSFGGSDYRWWLSGDGWGEASHSIGSYWGSNYTSGTVWTYDHFTNGIFCAFQTTHVYYSDNNVVGHGSGGVGGYVNTWDGGGCSGLLSYYSVVSGGA